MRKCFFNIVNDKQIKLYFVFLIIFLFSCLPIFSFDHLSTGAGFRITPYFEQLSIKATGYNDANIENTWADMAIYAFFDAKYLEFNLSYYRSFFGYYEQSGIGFPFDMKTEYIPINISYLELALFIKIPFTVGPAGKSYIFAGFAYKLNLTSNYIYKENNGDVNKELWDQMWVKFGGGFDIPIYRKLFFRTEFTIGVSIITEEWKNRKKALQTILTGFSDLDIGYFGLGAELTVAIGYVISSK